MPRGWYSYNFTASSANKFLPTSYDPMTVKPQCEDGNTICAIYAYYSPQIGGGKPPHPNPFPNPGNMRSYLSNVPASLQAQPIGANKKYVYLIEQ